MSRVSGALSGAAGGLAGVLAGHGALLGARALTGDSDIWLKGAHGPPFFDLALATTVFFAALGACAGGGPARRRLARGAAGAGAAFAALTLPMALATRTFAWGETSTEPSWAWVYLVLACYGAANAAGAWAIGWVDDRGSWRSGARTLAAAGAAWAVDRLVQWLLAGAINPIVPSGVLPPPAAVLSGAIWGAAIGAALPPRPRPAPAAAAPPAAA